MYDKLIVRNGEISIKKKNKFEFVNALMRNLRAATKNMQGVKVTKNNNRIELNLADGVDYKEVISKIKNIFGVVTISPAMSGDSGYDNLIELVKELVRLKYEQKPFKTFKVTTKRIDKSIAMTSMQMNADLGEKILAEFENLDVDVNNPDVIIHIEFRERQNIVFTEKIESEGGLPRGINGKTCVLLSGGIDSPVATYLMARRGLFVEAVHFHSYPFTSEKGKEKVLELVKILTGYCGNIRVHLVNLLPIQQEINEKCNTEYMTILSRRFMMRIAQEIALSYGALSLVTGESLGQVASQTSEGLICSDAVVDKLPVFRPLIATDKQGIIDIARQINTYETSIIQEEDCCTVFLPKNPATKPKKEKCEKNEARLDVQRLVQEAIDNREIIEF
ncbi:tRNA uracil 4-sulfurtransferase ThiI [Criibacterium bergeronii]|uniref:Probable tRNA sulfurtransferase n=1 Tax=Criibacterium bergeronii TaxID=1871336 RepID=A0A371IK09_9FIRM|nr:tRNA uracil 4-sulfurtransferase ThiI [Criibacterium bergeronii]MBS6063332.1 tRNA 4-thiouridine(8) synthase ThiI [Peptostreptococcaceae bacterium]RDY20806.1 tRNA 4-thiouridine(8) synthase ThiI [Criibacterium bergeronii]